MHIQKVIHRFFCGSHDTQVKKHSIPQTVRCEDFDHVIKKFEAYMMKGEHEKIIDKQQFLCINRFFLINAPNDLQMETYRKYAVEALIRLQSKSSLTDDYYNYAKRICKPSEFARIYQSPQWRAAAEQIKVKNERERIRNNERMQERYEYRKAKLSFHQALEKAEQFLEANEYDKIIDLYLTTEQITREEKKILWGYVLKSAKAMRKKHTLIYEDYDFFWRNATFFEKIKFSY